MVYNTTNIYCPIIIGDVELQADGPFSSVNNPWAEDRRMRRYSLLNLNSCPIVVMLTVPDVLSSTSG